MIMKQQHAVATKATHINGLDVQAAADTIATMKADKTLAKFQFRAKNVWISGGEKRSTIRDFYGAGREDKSRSKAFEFINGEPPRPARRQRGSQSRRVSAPRARRLRHHDLRPACHGR